MTLPIPVRTIIPDVLRENEACGYLRAAYTASSKAYVGWRKIILMNADKFPLRNKSANITSPRIESA